ncbi:SapC family protein [Rhodoferax aquaticus]|uniref:SapC family protein n=1 Tax=Rhodoferax aquaticus TaxID=2527691 RepID=A0A515EP85_9BURK|nr:SapC family protein [Rhodoferax aquaticus]QDL54471.1 SapC family protein [Rhodoferax aquaticus]
MTTMLFYQSVKALNREQHRKLRLLQRSQPFSFAAKTNSVLVASSEFVEASRHYPLVFVGAEGGPYSAAALVGLRDQENLFVEADGAWETDAYVPAFVRRYPFVLAENGKSLTVCVDETYDGLGETAGLPLFNAQGEESDFLKEVLGFLEAFHEDMQRTHAFAARLAELGLLSAKTITLEQQGEQQQLNGLWVVDEDKLLALSDAQVGELHRNGYLAAIRAHLVSLRNVDRLAVRVDARRALAQAADQPVDAVHANAEPPKAAPPKPPAKPSGKSK